jgi:hypothetical protein
MGHNNLHAIGAVFTEQRSRRDQDLGAYRGRRDAPPRRHRRRGWFDQSNHRGLRVGQMRTGGISGVATDCLAAPDADELALIGTGKQALLQVASVSAVRPLKRLRVFSPRSESRKQFIAKARGELDLEMIEAASVAEAVRFGPQGEMWQQVLPRRLRCLREAHRVSNRERHARRARQRHHLRADHAHDERAQSARKGKGSDQAVFFDTNPIPMKYMMKRLGILERNEHRLPMVPATPELEKRLDGVLVRAGLLKA